MSMLEATFVNDIELEGKSFHTNIFTLPPLVALCPTFDFLFSPIWKPVLGVVLLKMDKLSPSHVHPYVDED